MSDDSGGSSTRGSRRRPHSVKSDDGSSEDVMPDVVADPGPARTRRPTRVSLRPSEVLEAKLSRSVSANQTPSDRAHHHVQLSSSRVGAGVPVSASALRSHASFLMRELDSSGSGSRHSLDSSTMDMDVLLNDGGKLTRNMLGDSFASNSRRSSAASDRYCE